MIICGPPGAELTDGDRRVVRLFVKFMRDPRGRCRVCMHKLTRHDGSGCTRCRKHDMGECPIRGDSPQHAPRRMPPRADAR